MMKGHAAQNILKVETLLKNAYKPNLYMYNVNKLWSALLEKSATWNPFCPVFRTLWEKGSQKGSLHVHEPKKVPYTTKNDSKEPKKVLKMILKTHLEPFREPLRVPPVGQPKKPFFLRV